MIRRLFVTLAVLALVAAGCGEGDSVASSTPQSPAAETPAAPEAISSETAPKRPAPTTSATTTVSPTTTTTTTEAMVEPTYRSVIHEIDEVIASRMSSSWREGCPVGLDELRLIELAHYDFAGAVQPGEIVVHADQADAVVAAFERLFDLQYPIEQMRLVDEFDGDDDKSMAANNTSAFNCRFVSGTSRWSEHAYGRAIDINPLINPYIRGGSVSPPGGAAYVDRDQDHPALIKAGDEVVAAFADNGWSWGGYWKNIKDYQHFSASGR